MIQQELPADLLMRALDACPMAIIFHRLMDPMDDRSFVMVYANDASARALGLSKEEILGERLDKKFPAVQERGFIERFARVMRTGQSETYEDNYYADHRLEAAFSGSVTRISDDIIAVSYENLTLRRQVEAEAARARALQEEARHRAALLVEVEAQRRAAEDAIDTYELVASAAEEALWEIRLDEPGASIGVDTPCRFSDRFAQITGLTPAEVVPLVGTFQKIIHPEDVDRILAEFREFTREPSRRMEAEYRIITRSGEVRTVLGSARMRVDAEGRPTKCAGTIRDITAEKRAEAELRERIALIERQQSLIEELSTPILEVWDDIIALPIVGTLDDKRAAATMGELLEAIVQKGVRFALLDLTGVEALDAGTATHVVRIAQAAALLGARALITGIQPAVARTIVELGIDLSVIETRRNLQDGLRECLELVAREQRGRVAGLA
jgi:PAS domain S-box-containing protein